VKFFLLSAIGLGLCVFLFVLFDCNDTWVRPQVYKSHNHWDWPGRLETETQRAVAASIMRVVPLGLQVPHLRGWHIRKLPPPSPIFSGLPFPLGHVGTLYNPRYRADKRLQLTHSQSPHLKYLLSTFWPTFRAQRYRYGDTDTESYLLTSPPDNNRRQTWSANKEFHKGASCTQLAAHSHSHK